jgi:hypothetical protein
MAVDPEIFHFLLLVNPVRWTGLGDQRLHLGTYRGVEGTSLNPARVNRMRLRC